MLYRILTYKPLFQVYAAGSEDMDTLTFGTPILYRHLTFSEAKKQPILEVDLKKTLEGLDMTKSQVRSFCPFVYNVEIFF
jgi:flap endonuclease-1